jgi:eukaryotic-like serine/threonine-protein kinase
MDLVGHVTPVMSDDERHRSQQLSLRRLRPPLKVPGYEQEQFVGRGAFGEVWSAVDSNSGRRVAIKFYSHRGSLDWSNMAREVEKLRFLFADRYVVQLFEVGWDSNPPYFVMEYMPDGSLADRVQDGPLPVAEAVKLFREIATGLVHAHGRGVLHCDLKPSNIMLDEDGRPRLADFGQSRLSHEHSPSLGTFFFMAPEQADPQAVPDVRWDVYALGAILYKLLTGKAPYQTAECGFALSSQTTLREKLAAYRHYLETSPRPDEYRRMPGVDGALAAILRGCLAINPNHRYDNVQAVLDALNERDRRRAQRPLFQLGALGPAAVLVVMAVIAFAIFNVVLSTAQLQLVDRALESDRFAAHLVASRFALEVDRRWRCLEQEATDDPVQQALKEPGSPTASDGNYAALQSWLEERHRYWNTQFSANTPASYWLVLDREGCLRAISPAQPALVGHYFGYRDYFHGQGSENEIERRQHTPIAAPHRSDVFVSQPENVLSVSFSVPIRDADSPSSPPLGVLAMEADLGHFAEFVGARNQFAAIVDLRPDETGRKGLIAEHPRLHGREAGELRRYVSETMLAGLVRLREQHLAETKPDSENVDTEEEPGGEGQFESYDDPLEPKSAGHWLCSAEPTFVQRGSGGHDTGWTVLVEEPRSDVVAPLHRLWRLVAWGGLAAVGLVALVLTALWIYVLCHLSEVRGTRRFLRRLIGMAESLRSTTSSQTLTSGPTARSQKRAP